MVNKACKWCQIETKTGRYTCPIKPVNEELLFKFEREWHSVAKYAAESAHELAHVGSKLMNMPYKE